MSVNDELGKRMKEFYEQVPKTRLMRRTPVAIRLDGKTFHTFTKGFKRPYDEILMRSMQNTMLRLCESIQGCVIGYTQSDEITLILQDFSTLKTEAWFDYEVQKMCSIASSMATLYFNQSFRDEVNKYTSGKTIGGYEITLFKARDKGAMFDARVFNIPKEEVANLILWRQLDATRNAIQMLGQSNFSHKQLQNKSCNEIQDMLMTQKGINFNDMPTEFKRGSCCVRKACEILLEDCSVIRNKWVVDREIPIFKNEDRNYIESRIKFD